MKSLPADDWPVAAIAIGRNEGERLVLCLQSLKQATPVVYVDSGSTDGSVDAARALDAKVVELDMTLPFTAARARNAGLATLGDEASDFVQMIDGDCEMRENWLRTAADFLAAHPDVAMVSGRLRERNADATLWNRLADSEWASSEGEVTALGGIAMLRRSAVLSVGGYREDLIAGEEPELCLRLRRAGWKIWRLEAEMAWHDIAMTRASQWWRRMRRGGHAYAEGWALHRQGPERYRRRELMHIILWGVVLPIVTICGAVAISPWALALLLLWPFQMLRQKNRGLSWETAVFLTLGKLPEAHGVLDYVLARLRRQRRELIEYK